MKRVVAGDDEGSRSQGGAFVLVAFAAFTLVLHVVVNVTTPYGLHRDEFLYLAMGQHLELFRMDFPPLIAILAEAQRAMLGESLAAIRLAPALAGAALVALAGLMCRVMGGSAFSQALAMTCVLANALLMRSASLFQPVVFDQLWWTVGYYALARLCREAEPRWWLMLGVTAGLGLLTKFSILFFGVGVAVALLATPLRRQLLTRWPWIALAITMVIGAPSLAGQIALDWPLRYQMAGLQQAQLARVTHGEFLGEQLLFGAGTLVAVAGMVSLLAGRLRPFRVLGIATLTSFVVLLVLRGKAYYAGPIYPALFAAGAIVVDSIRHARAAPILRWSVTALVALYGVATLPMGLPVLPPPAMAQYAARLGVTSTVRTNRGELLELPQDYADMLGWEQQSAAVARAFRSLPEQERRDAVLLASNYGQAGALDFYGPRYGLPKAISTAGSYWQFGPGDKPGRVVVALGLPASQLREAFDSVTTVARVNEPWVVPEERNREISVARGPRTTFQAAWPRLGPNYH